MKFIITESKLDELIMSQIDSRYNVDDFLISYAYDDDLEETGSALEYSTYDGSETLFRWYDKDYWNEDNQHRIEQSPILMIEDDNFVSTLNGLFGKKWIPVFKSWFEYNFNKPVKTIDYY